MKAIFFILSILIVLFCASCGSLKYGTYGSPNIEQTLLNDNTFVVNEYSKDATYGYTQENPIMVGSQGGSGPLNERRFLNALTGPNGEPITYKRLGSCCAFKTKNGMFDNGGLLDKYEIAHKGLDEPIILYINMYDSDILKIPVGFEKK
ncbi:MAG: hypothetical protein LBV43_13130 [Prevotella sp.]|jgi:hypothetical protein|nr:hypothetical protein [Prevotella sp.]